MSEAAPAMAATIMPPMSMLIAVVCHFPLISGGCVCARPYTMAASVISIRESTGAILLRKAAIFERVVSRPNALNIILNRKYKKSKY
jgi:hypothetical protein